MGIGASVQNKKYNDKEFIEMHGLDEYDSEARWFYPAIMRTTTIDPLAEKYYSISPYAWCENNPVRIIDPTGKSGEDTTGKPSEINKSTGVPTSAQSSVRVPEQPKEKFDPVLYNPPIGEIKDANKENFKKMHNQAMNDPIGKQCLTDPFLKASATFGLIVTAPVMVNSIGTALAPEATTVGINTIKGAQTIGNVFNVALTTTETFSVPAMGLGAGVGWVQSLLPFDAPTISITPVVDLWSSTTNTLITVDKVKNNGKP